MIKIYFKQAWAMMKHNCLFSSMYIMGTAVTIALVMILFIILYIKLGPVYPEYNRDRMIYLKYINFKINNGNNRGMTGVSYETLQRLLPIEDCEYKTIISLDDHETKMIDEVKDSYPMFTCHNFWKIYDFDFLYGKGYTLEQLNNNRAVPVVVLSESLARKLFATADAVGKIVTVKDIEHRVVGVVRDVSGSTPTVFADYWIPVNTPLASVGRRGGENMLGNYMIFFLVKEKSKIPMVKSKITETLSRIASEQPHDNEYQPMLQTHAQFVMGDEYQESLYTFLGLLSALLFIPALSLCGMIASRMNSRMDEIGVRKAFGATNRQLVFQVLCENMLFTTVGAVLGLLLSYLFAFVSQEWIVTLLDSYIDSDVPTAISVEMLVNPTIISITIFLIFILNILSALVPTLYSLRHSITDALSRKK